MNLENEDLDNGGATNVTADYDVTTYVKEKRMRWLNDQGPAVPPVAWDPTDDTLNLDPGGLGEDGQNWTSFREGERIYKPIAMIQEEIILRKDGV
jgi:hypothetical protein